jgi:two-component system, LuxR family, sensor kinase FixL
MAGARTEPINPIEGYLAFSESRRAQIFLVVAVLIAVIAYSDWRIRELRIGYLYVLPILMASAMIRSWQIALLSLGCALLREWFGPLHGGPDAAARIGVSAAGFALAGYFVSELNRQRSMVAAHLRERAREMLLRMDAERQLQVVIETSPLGIVTLDGDGRVLLANSSAQHLLRLEHQGMAGQDIRSHLPILERFLRMRHSAPNLRTVVESRGQRADGEPFLAHLWLSTFFSGSRLHVAVFIWDATENLRDREGTGLDSMMATSRILVGAMSHEIRNLAAAAAVVSRELASGLPDPAHRDRLQALGAVVDALEGISSSGLRLATHSSAAVADLGMVLEESRVLIEASLRDEGGAAHWDIPHSLPLVQADHHSLLQVLLNLARNSEAAMKDAPTKMIWVEVSVRNDMVDVRFRDSGPGIVSPEVLFRPFQSGAASSGLGLYISRAVLRSAGGDLYYEPQPRGGCFVVQLRASDAGQGAGVA